MPSIRGLLPEAVSNPPFLAPVIPQPFAGIGAVSYPSLPLLSPPYPFPGTRSGNPCPFPSEQTPLSFLLTTAYTSSNDTDWATIQGQLSFSSSLSSPCFNPRVVLSWKQTEKEVNVTFETNLVPIKKVKCGDDLLEIFQMIETLLPNSGFVMCLGLDESAVEDLNFDCRNVRKWGFPFKRTDHVECLMWFQRPPNSSLSRCGSVVILAIT